MSAKNLILKPISANEANAVVKKHHYSQKIVPNSQIHFGVFYNGRLEGALQYGPSMDKRKVMQLVSGTEWNGFLELNRMAFSEALPKNSESRAIAVSLRLLKKYMPHVDWVISYADATQCGDGTIYRASGFKLVGIKENKQILNWNGKIIAKKTLDNENYPKPDGKYYSRYLLETGQAVPLKGFQLKYIYFLNSNVENNLVVPVLPFDEIAKRGAKMYLGQGLGGVSNTSTIHVETDSANLIPRLQNFQDG